MNKFEQYEEQFGKVQDLIEEAEKVLQTITDERIRGEISHAILSLERAENLFYGLMAASDTESVYTLYDPEDESID